LIQNKVVIYNEIIINVNHITAEKPHNHSIPSMW